MTISRANQIAYLEQHWARMLANELRDHAKAITELVERNAYMTNGTEVLGQSLGIPRTLRAIAADMHQIAERSRISIHTAQLIPDELLDDYIRHETLPKWREAMQKLGYEWDAEELRWRKND